MQVKVENGRPDGPHLAPSDHMTPATLALPDAPDLEEELDAMVSDLRGLTMDAPDEVIMACAAFMGRCTELHIRIVRVEGGNRHLKYIRTQQLVPVMDLIEFMYRAASRVVEIRRQDVELARQ